MAGKLATIFDKAAQWTAKQCGKAHTFVAAIAVVILWGVSGPLFVRGGIKVLDSRGEPYEIRNRVTLCRCGRSSNKPLCDGSHQSPGAAEK